MSTARGRRIRAVDGALRWLAELMESRAVVRIILVLLCVDLACTASVVTLAQDRASVELAERVGVFCLDVFFMEQPSPAPDRVWQAILLERLVRP